MDVSNTALLSPASFDSPIYTFKQPYPQQFSLPFDVIKYMIKNCKSGKVWKKLIKSCKHFYSKFPLLPLKRLDVNARFKCKADGELFDASKFLPKLWLYDKLFANQGSKMSTLIPKILKFNLRVLRIEDQNLTFADYKKLTSSGSVESLSLLRSTIKNADGTIVTADKLLGELYNLRAFSMVYSNNLLMLQTETVKKMVQHLNGYKKMLGFKLIGINENFDFALFSDFLLNNETASIYLCYGAPVSNAYKKIVENVVKEINKNPSLMVPTIEFYRNFY